MSRQLSPLMSRVAAVALFAAMLFLAWSLVLDPLVASYREAQATIERLRPAIDRAGGEPADLAALKARIDQLKARQQDGAGLLTGTNESIASAQLQTRLKSIAETAKAELKSTQILASHDAGSFRKIAVRGLVVGSLAAVQRILFTLESTSPYLFLDDVQIRLAPVVSRGTAEAAPGLELRVDVSGYLRRAT